ncbi:MAG: transposase family protein [Actinomycetota bacterium]|nr:transposase family protein [Actinomycetota bacterium]
MTLGASLQVPPVIAESYAIAPGAGTCDPDLSGVAVEGTDLLRRFGVVSEGRSEQGRDHPVAVALTLCAVTVLAGMRSFTAITGWVADVPTELPAQLYTQPTGPPSKTTLWRMLTGADPAPVDAAVGT